jgi:hypothetical protein
MVCKLPKDPEGLLDDVVKRLSFLLHFVLVFFDQTFETKKPSDDRLVISLLTFHDVFSYLR